MEKRLTYTIDTYEGIWTLDKTYISDLGYLMAKFYQEDRGVWMNVNLGDFDSLIGGTMSIQTTITKE